MVLSSRHLILAPWIWVPVMLVMKTEHLTFFLLAPTSASSLYILPSGSCFVRSTHNYMKKKLNPRNTHDHEIKMTWDSWNLAQRLTLIWRPWKLSNFQDPLSIHLQTSSTLDLGRPISNKAPTPSLLPSSANDNQLVKRKHNSKMTIICYQVLPLGRLDFVFI